MSKSKIYRAGVIPYYIENDKVLMLFMKPSNSKFGGQSFQIAKGKIEEDEKSEDAALREGKEELGLFKHNIIKNYDLGNFLGRTHFYLSKIKDKTMFGDPHYETAETKWMTLDEFLDEGRTLHKAVVKAAHRLILKKEKL